MNLLLFLSLSWCNLLLYSQNKQQSIRFHFFGNYISKCYIQFYTRTLQIEEHLEEQLVIQWLLAWKSHLAWPNPNPMQIDCHHETVSNIALDDKRGSCEILPRRMLAGDLRDEQMFSLQQLFAETLYINKRWGLHNSPPPPVQCNNRFLYSSGEFFFSCVCLHKYFESSNKNIFVRFH